MAYQPFTVSGGSGGYSKLNAPDSVHSGSVTCYEGTCWVRLVKTPTVTASGANASMTNLPTGYGFDDGWAYLTVGASMSFGSERVFGADQSSTEPIGQVDLYLSAATVTVIQH